jgi:hypothetical protein
MRSITNPRLVTPAVQGTRTPVVHQERGHLVPAATPGISARSPRTWLEPLAVSVDVDEPDGTTRLTLDATT